MTATLDTQAAPIAGQTTRTPDTGQAAWAGDRASPGIFGAGAVGPDMAGVTLPVAQLALDQQLMACLAPGFERLARAGLIRESPDVLVGKVAGYAATLLRENWAGGG